MSKQEILSWTSIATTLSVLFFYLLFTIGWPAFLPDFSGNMAKIFFNLFIIAVVVEIIVNSVTSKKSVDKDERDFMIEAHGFRYGYFGHMVPPVSEHIVPLSTSDVKG